MKESEWIALSSNAEFNRQQRHREQTDKLDRIIKQLDAIEGFCLDYAQRVTAIERHLGIGDDIKEHE